MLGKCATLCSPRAREREAEKKRKAAEAEREWAEREAAEREAAPATSMKREPPQTAGTVEFMTDVEGNWDYFLSFVEFSDTLYWRSPDRGVWGPGTLELRSGCSLVFGGDAVDKGPGDIRFVKTLLDLRRRYPGRVFFILGNRELNKLRYNAELAPGENGEKFHVYWDLKAEKYSAYRERLSLEDSLVTTLRWMFDCNMGCQKTTFETRRKELALLAGSADVASVSDEAVVQSCRDSVDPHGSDPWMLELMQAGQIALVIGGDLYVHGGLSDEKLGRVPGGQSPCPTVQEWAERLNAWKDAQLQDYMMRPAWRSEDTSSCAWDARGRRRGGDELIEYGTPHSNISIIYHNPFDNGNAQLCSAGVEESLLKSGIRRVFSGHQPHGQSPSVVRQPQSGLLFVMADSSYSDMKASKLENAANNRGIAVSIVKTCGDKVTIRGQLADGTNHGCELRLDPRLDCLPDALVGRQLQDGSWCKTVLADGSVCTVRGEGFKLDMCTYDDISKPVASLKDAFKLPCEVEYV